MMESIESTGGRRSGKMRRAWKRERESRYGAAQVIAPCVGILDLNHMRPNRMCVLASAFQTSRQPSVWLWPAQVSLWRSMCCPTSASLCATFTCRTAAIPIPCAARCVGNWWV
jgi:hypothetical protein